MMKCLKYAGILWIVFFISPSLVDAKNQHQRPSRAPSSFQEADAEVTQSRMADTLPTPEQLTFKPHKIALLPFQNKTRSSQGGEPAAAAAEAKVLENLSKAGGIEIFERTRLQSIMKELENSVSDLFAEDGITRVGQLSKVDYVVAGSVDNVLAKRDISKTNYGVSYRFEGGATVRLRVIEVATGKVVFTGQENETRYESSQDPYGADLNSMVESAASKAAEEFRDDIQNLFPLRGYVINLSDDESGALINLGAEQNVVKNRVFEFIASKNISNKITGKASVVETVIGEGKIREVLPQESWLFVGNKKLREKIQI